MTSPKYIAFLLLAALLAMYRVWAQHPVATWDERIAALEAESPLSDSLGYYYHQKADYYRQVDSLADWAYTYWDWQAAVFDSTRLALALLDTVLQTAWRTPATPEESEAMLWVQVNRGHHLFLLGKILASTEAYEAAWKYYQDYHFEDFDAIQYLYLPLGANYTRLGDNEKARVLYETAIANHPDEPLDGALAGIYVNLGLTYWNEGNYAKAIDIYKKGLEGTDIPSIKTGLLFLNLGESYFDDGQYGLAQLAVDKAIAIFQNENDPDIDESELLAYRSGAFALKGSLLAEQHQSTAAFAMLEKALAVGKAAFGDKHHRDIAKIWVTTGRLHLQTGDFQKATAAFNLALEEVLPNFHPRLPNDLPLPEQFYEENTIYEALEGKADALQLAYQLDHNIQHLAIALQCHQLAGKVERKLRRLYQYESSKITAVGESRRRVEKAIDIARDLYQITGDITYLYAAWENVEQTKSIVLLEAIMRNRFDSRLGVGDTLLLRQQELENQVAAFERNLLLEPTSELRAEWLRQKDELLTQLVAVGKALEERYPALRVYLQQAAIFSASDITKTAAALPNHQIAAYFIGENHLDIFSLKANNPPVWVRVDKVDSLRNETQALLQLMQSRSALESTNRYRPLAFDLYKTLLSPVLSANDNRAQNLLIVPDAWLAFLPFEALLEDTTQTAWNKAPYLLRKYNLQYAFSLAVMQAQQALPSAAMKNILQLAPQFADGQRGLPPLTNSTHESPASKLNASDLWLDQAAGFEAFRQLASEYKVLHLSTHAGVDSTGLLPHVEFYDQTAYLPDIYALHLNADLVTLSACQTGLGQIQKGEGVMSLSRAFAFAGAKGLVTSLWSINENATSQVFRRMYQSLLQGAAKPTALYQAKLAYLDDPNIPAFQKSPYYWAGLVYFGDDAPIHWTRRNRLAWWLVIGALVIVIATWSYLKFRA